MLSYNQYKNVSRETFFFNFRLKNITTFYDIGLIELNINIF